MRILFILLAWSAAADDLIINSTISSEESVRSESLNDEAVVSKSAIPNEAASQAENLVGTDENPRPKEDQDDSSKDGETSSVNPQAPAIPQNDDGASSEVGGGVGGGGVGGGAGSSPDGSPGSSPNGSPGASPGSSPGASPGGSLASPPLTISSGSLMVEKYSYEGDDYPGADGGVLVALWPRAVGPVEPLELDVLSEVMMTDVADEADSASVPLVHRVWPESVVLVPYYEWMIAQARGNRFALPEPIVQQLEQLNRAMESFVNLDALKQIPVVEGRRRLQLDTSSLLSVLNASFLSADSDLTKFNAQHFPGLVNAVSGGINNVVQVAGEAVGVTTTTPKPVNQAVLGMLSILQGFQKLAEAAGSMGLVFKN